MTVAQFTVTGMTCTGCEASVRGNVEKDAGVRAVDVSVETGRLLVSSDSGAVDAEAVIAAVEAAGYRAVQT